MSDKKVYLSSIIVLQEIEITALKAENESAMNDLQEKCEGYPFEQNTLSEAVWAIILTLKGGDMACDDLHKENKALKARVAEFVEAMSTIHWCATRYERFNVNKKSLLTDAKAIEKEAVNALSHPDLEYYKRLLDGERKHKELLTAVTFNNDLKDFGENNPCYEARVPVAFVENSKTTLEALEGKEG